MTKTYYMFFIKKPYYDKLETSRLPFGDEQLKYIYGYTDNKKLYKSFKKSRDMNKFKIIIESVNSEFINFLAREYQHAIIRDREIISSNNHVDAQIVHIAMTDEEYLDITMHRDCLENYLSSYLDFNPFIFQKNITASLLKLGYAHYSMFIKYDEVSDSWFKEKFYDKVISENPIEYDLLKIFLDRFGILFTK